MPVLLQGDIYLMNRSGGILESIGAALSHVDGNVMSYVTMAIRLILPVLAILVVIRCLRSLINEKSEAENWGYLSLPNGARIYLNHWECLA